MFDNYEIIVQISGKKRHLIWRGNHDFLPDSILVQDGKLCSFPNSKELHLFASANNILIPSSNKVNTIDLDEVQSWVESGANYLTKSNCDSALTAWNVSIDATTKASHDSSLLETLKEPIQVYQDLASGVLDNANRNKPSSSVVLSLSPQEAVLLKRIMNQILDFWMRNISL